MKLFDRIEQLKNEEEEPEIIITNPKTEGQKWFEDETQRKLKELNEREQNVL